MKTGIKLVLVLLGLFFVVFLALAALGFAIIFVKFAIFAAVIYGLFRLWLLATRRKEKNSAPSEPRPKAISAHRLWEGDGSIALYLREPSIAELSRSKDNELAKELADQGVVLTIPSNTPVSVITDDGGIAIKVKVLEGAAKGKTGWVSASAVVRENSEV